MDADSQVIIEKLSLIIHKRMATLSSKQRQFIPPIKHKDQPGDDQKDQKDQLKKDQSKQENIKMLQSQISKLLRFRSEFEILITDVDLKN